MTADIASPERALKVQRRVDGPALFALAYAVYFGFGAINFVPLRGTVGMNVVWLAAAGLVAYGVGVWLGQLLASPHRSALHSASGNTSDVKGWRPVAAIFGVVGAMSAVGIVMQFGGFPLFAGEERREISGILTGLMYGLILSVTITGGHALFHRKWKTLMLCVLGSSMLILLGYRTFVLVPFGAIFFTARNLDLVKLRISFVFLGGALIYALSWLSVYRFGAGKDAALRYVLALGMPEQYTAFVPLWMTAREGTSVLALLVAKIPDVTDYLYGQMLASSFLTMLPGKQQGPRLEVAEYVGGRPGITITPSILGQPYVDFGVIGVVVFMLLVGVLLKSLWLWQQASLTWAPRAASAFVLTVFLLDIHAGLLDAPIIGSGVVITWWAYRAESREAIFRGPTRRPMQPTYL